MFRSLTSLGSISIAAGLGLVAFFGCGKPQAAPRNRQLIASLRTAVNTRNAAWLDQNARIVEERHAAGKMSADEYEEFRSIITMAEEGQWAKAEQDVIAFQKAQRPTGKERKQVGKLTD